MMHCVLRPEDVLSPGDVKMTTYTPSVERTDPRHFLIQTKDGEVSAYLIRADRVHIAK